MVSPVGLLDVFLSISLLLFEGGARLWWSQKSPGGLPRIHRGTNQRYLVARRRSSEKRKERAHGEYWVGGCQIKNQDYHKMKSTFRILPRRFSSLSYKQQQHEVISNKDVDDPRKKKKKRKRIKVFVVVCSYC